VKVRRVVVGNNQSGRTVILSDEPAPHSHDFTSLPGQSTTRIWRTPGEPSTTPPAEEPTTEKGPLLPAPGGVIFQIVRYAPGEVTRAPGFDGAAAAAEFRTWAPDIAALTDLENPRLHRHPTLDFAVVLEGEIWLEVDDGVETCLSVGDTLVQIDGRHTWHNRTDQPATIALMSAAARP
jgi:hypothetical protein